MKHGYRKEMDMLSGTLWDKILIYALPLAFTGILQQLFNAADVAVIGRFVGKSAMAAVGSNSPLIGLLVNLFVGISLGTNVVIANATGQGNDRQISKAVHTSILTALICGVVMMLVGEAAAPPLLRILSVPDEVLPMAALYLRIYVLGLPVIFLYNFEAAIFRSRGDTKTPLMVLTISGIANVILNLFFVLGLKMTVDGVALATVLSNLISSVLLFYFLKKSDSAVAVHMDQMRIDGDVLKRILAIGVPSGVQSMVFSLANLCIQSAINGLGTTVMAASSAAFNLEIFAYYVLASFGQACTTFVGQNHGARLDKRCRKTLWICLGLDFACTLFACAMILIFHRTLLGIFNQDPEVVHFGFIRLAYIFASYGFSLTVEVVSGYLRGFGLSVIPAVLSLVGICGVRIAWVYTVFARTKTFSVLMGAYPVSLGMTAAGVCIAALLYEKRRDYGGNV